MISRRYLILALYSFFVYSTHLCAQIDTLILNNSVRLDANSVSPVQISLSNISTISGIQFELKTNPNNLGTIEVMPTIRTKGIFDLIEFTKNSDGNITVVALSTKSNNLILAGKGNILTINCSLNPPASSGSIRLKMSNFILIDKNGVKKPTFIQEVINQKILFDESHHERNTISDVKAQILNPEFPDRASFSTLKAELTKNFIVENYPSGTITTSLLKNYDVLTLSAPEDNFSSMEISSIVSFVNEGGSLCFLGDVGINEGINSILKNFGIQFINTPILSIVETGQDPGLIFINFINHPSLGLNPQCLTSWGGSFNISPPAIAVGFSDSLTWRELDGNMIKDINEPFGPFKVITASVYGKGKIFCISENSFNNEFAKAYGTYNNELIINAIQWLTGPPSAPNLLNPLNLSNGILTNTKLEWVSVGSTINYRIQVSKSQDFKLIIIDSLVTINSIQINNLALKSKYYWRVNAIDNDGESEWSEVWSFTTNAYNFIMNTGNSATISFPASSIDQTIQIGDEIGVFTPQGLCVGSGIWENKDLVISAWGDNDQSPSIDGIKAGELFSFRIWRKAAGSEQNITCLTYSQGNGKYSPDGISIISSIIIPVTPTIIQNGDILHSDALTGNQWHNKDGAIVGATTQDFSPKSSGDYYVVATLNGCTSNPSNSIQFIPTGINSIEASNLIKVYPNPVNNELILEFQGNSKKIDFEILNSIGQVVFTGILVEKTFIQTAPFNSGIYLIQLKTGDAIVFKKIIKM